jgi:hypothetical protein
MRWPSVRTRRRWARTFRRQPLTLQALAALVALAAVWFTANLVYQVVRKPTELFFPVSGVLYKTPEETWRAYRPIFRAHATDIMTPDLLAAIAQVEGSGNPVVRTYWRWSLTRDPFEVYRPASSAVGMYQFTDGTFEEARRFCIRDRHVVEDGAWHDWRSCWFNALYSRVVPSHAVEMASAYLDRHVNGLLARRGIERASLAQKQTLAALIHLCGAGAGREFVRRGLAFAPGQRCGDHDAQVYVARVRSMQTRFRTLAARE